MNITYGNQIGYADYTKLRSSAGWPTICEEQALSGIRSSKFVIVARDGDKTVGLARVVADGGFVAYLADVLVLPEYQKKNIGTEMVSRLEAQVKADMKEGYHVHFVLMAAKDKERFYEKFGFITRPNDDVGPGMAKWLTK